METKDSLLIRLASLESLNSSWTLLNKENKRSYGLSGISIHDFNQDLDTNLNNISNELKKGTFRFSKTRAAIIKKDNGNYRPLQIPEIRDRVVLKAMAVLLEENLRDILQKSDGISFAYQQGSGVREAVLKMKSLFKNGGKVIFKTDIINFFEDIKKSKLLDEIVFPQLKDDSLNKLIKQAVSQELGGLNRISKGKLPLFKNRYSGIPQGNPLSPLLSNIYLSDFDLQLKEQGYFPVRYADDFIVIFKSQHEALKGYEEIRTLLKQKFSLEIHPLEEKNSKTEICNPTEKEFSFLSIKFDGQDIYPGKDSLGILKSRIKKVIKSNELHDNLLNEIYETLNIWIALYSYLDIERYFSDIDQYLKLKLMHKFKGKSFKIKTCVQLAHETRTKQYFKNKNGVWRKPELAQILPKFINKFKIRHQYKA